MAAYRALMSLISSSNEEPLQDQCNGLIPSKNEFIFYAPVNEPEFVICNVCHSEANNKDEYTKIKSIGYPCYSFLKDCTINNGLFYVSLWLPTLRTYYSTGSVFAGCPFLINITAKLKKDQIYTCRLVIEHNGQEYTLNGSKNYYDQDCIISDGASYKKFMLLTAEQEKHPLIASRSPMQLLDYGVIMNNSKIRLEFFVYEKTHIDYDTISNYHIGDFDYVEGQISCKSPAYVCKNFNVTASLYNYTLRQVNKVPNILTFPLEIQHLPTELNAERPTVNVSGYNKLLQTITNDIKKALNASMAERVKIKAAHDKLSTDLLELTTKVTAQETLLKSLEK